MNGKFVNDIGIKFLMSVVNDVRIKTSRMPAGTKIWLTAAMICIGLVCVFGLIPWVTVVVGIVVGTVPLAICEYV